MLTASGWHDDARNRDAGHDEMQADIFRRLSAIEPKLCVHAPHGQISGRRISLGIERPFILKGRILAFADVCEEMNAQDAEWDFTMFRCYEIKPKIYSMGALIRQAKATMATIRHVITSAGMRADCEIINCVPHDDPKAKLVQEFWPATQLWHREEKRWVGDIFRHA